MNLPLFPGRGGLGVAGSNLAAPTTKSPEKHGLRTSGLARSDLVAEHVHAGGTARVALALRIARELVDVHLAFRPGLLVGQLLGRLLRVLLGRKCRIGDPKR